MVDEYYEVLWEKLETLKVIKETRWVCEIGCSVSING